MNRDEAMKFLKDNLPLPPDSEMSEAQILAFNEARDYFLEHPDAEAIPLLLNCFGEGSGYGAYQLIEDVLAKLPVSAVLPHLDNALRSQSPSIRFWASQIAARIPDPSLVPALARLALETDVDSRYAAVTALERISGESALAALRVALHSETDEELRSVIQQILGEPGGGHYQ